MIIKYPTGLYRNELETFVTQTNVTYNISNNLPPRSNILFVKLPTGQRIKTLPELEVNRSVLGDLIFSISDSRGNNSQSTQKTLEVGTVLEFGVFNEDIAPIELTVPSSEIAHNLYYIDYSELGLNPDEIAQIDGAVLASFNEKTKLINDLKTEYSNIFNEVQNLQKKSNDLARAINAITLSNSSGSLTEYLDRLVADKASNDDLIILLNNQLIALTSSINSETDSLRTLGALVK